VTLDVFVYANYLNVRIWHRLPLPPANFCTLYKNDEQFKESYFEKFPVKIFAGDEIS